jgi:hypothetical protein
MLEERVIKRSHHAEIMKSIDFQLQEFLGFTSVIFPYKQKGNPLHSLTGMIIQRFENPISRIQTGKILYGMLFGSTALRGVLQFARNKSYTGSRSDYWDSIFIDKQFKSI